ncbi:GGDEF domain-containing protein [Nocardioides sp. zg-536]|uniref:GGDEF domain-containing protein n=1 Tax=Nocardioides faecalis TaxID=2803858 RepID=A0A938Y827_9ACTN|nr:GGDEF domain-containing protein [Nocardioides faecalis]MBM9459893.1 GGDEF domain-containing protein [Nocardioides faecalis]QVI58874.1 GGDEF domain-containing protein [Nocardioides faecalis]
MLPVSVVVSLVVAALAAGAAVVVALLRRRDSLVVAAALGCSAGWCVAAAKSDPGAPDFMWWSALWLPCVSGWCAAVMVLARRTAVPGWRPPGTWPRVLVAVPFLILAIELVLLPLEVFGGAREEDGEHVITQGAGWYVVTAYDIVLVGLALVFLIDRVAVASRRDRGLLVSVLAALGCTFVSQAAPDGTPYTHLFGVLVAAMLAHAALLGGLTSRPVPVRRVVRSVDAVTGCLDRAALEEVLATEVSAAERTGRPLSIGLLDLDNLKVVNDEHGHLVGDTVLRAAVERISGALRPGFVLGRFGGDEFVVIMPGTDLLRAHQVVGRCQEAAREPVRVGEGRTAPATFSAGVSSHAAGGSVADLLGAADAAMYVAKRAGGDRCHAASVPED